jgi:hypothetical protein
MLYYSLQLLNFLLTHCWRCILKKKKGVARAATAGANGSNGNGALPFFVLLVAYCAFSKVP